MNKTFFLIALLTGVVFQQAHADGVSPWYATVALGRTSVSDGSWNRTSVTSVATGTAKLNAKMGDDASQAASVGYRLNEVISFELEYALRTNRSSQVGRDTGFLLVGNEITTRADSLMFNAIYTWANAGGLRPFAGAGLGGARLEATIVDNNGTSSDARWSLAYQALLGVEIRLAKQYSIIGQYQYFAVPDPGIEVVRPQTSTSTNFWKVTDYVATSWSVGLRYHF